MIIESRYIEFFILIIIFSFFGCKKDKTRTSSGVDIIIPTGNESYLNTNSDYIFDQNELHSFHINLPEGAYAYLDSDPAQEKYVEGSLTFDGETISPIGVRYKGSIGAFVGGVSGEDLFNPSGSKTATKLSMKLKIDWKGYNTTFYNLKRLQFHSMNLDPSQLNERLGYWLFGQMGVPASRSVHAKLYINGSFQGLYALTEQIDEQFAKYHFSDGSGNLYKELWPLNSNGGAQSEDAFSNALVTNRVAGVRVNRIKQFADDIMNAESDELNTIVESMMDIDEVVAYAVVDRMIKNDDGAFHWYSFDGQSAPHNFFWYENPSENTLHLIPWDLDNAFENIISNANPVTPIADDWGQITNDCEVFPYGDWNLMQKSAACDKLVGSWSSYTTKYDQLKSQLINGPLSEAIVNSQLDLWVAQINNATIQASQQHNDAIDPAYWLDKVNELKAKLEYARTH